MLELVDVGERSLESYRGTAPDELLDAVAQVATALRGARVLHVNATPYGGGVSEGPARRHRGLSARSRGGTPCAG
jgi:trehalose synthase